MKISRTIEQLEGTPWPEPKLGDTGLVRRCHALRRVPLDQLGLGDLRVLIGQDIALKHLIPLALGKLKVEPMLEAEYYPGDLLVAVMSAERGFWATNLDSLSQLKQLAQRARESIGAHEDPSRFRHVAQDITSFQARSVT